MNKCLAYVCFEMHITYAILKHPTSVQNILCSYFFENSFEQVLKNRILLYRYFLYLFLEADYTLDDSFWNEESPAGKNINNLFITFYTELLNSNKLRF